MRHRITTNLDPGLGGPFLCRCGAVLDDAVAGLAHLAETERCRYCGSADHDKEIHETTWYCGVARHEDCAGLVAPTGRGETRRCICSCHKAPALEELGR